MERKQCPSCGYVEPIADVHALAPIDQDGKRADAPEPADLHDVPALDRFLSARLRTIRHELAEPGDGLDRYVLNVPDPTDERAQRSYWRSMELLQTASVPIAGRDGWRRTADGREWYSAAWLGLAV